MANQPIFVSGYRQDMTVLRADLGNAAQDVFTPGAAGTRLHAIALGNDGDADVTVEFGSYDIIFSGVEVNIVPGATPASDPFTVTRVDDRTWPITENLQVLTLWNAAAVNRGDYRLAGTAEQTPGSGIFDVLNFQNTPGNAVIQELGATIDAYRWRPLWAVDVPARAGFDGNPSVAGLDLEKMLWLDLTGDRWLLLAAPLAARIPANANAVTTGNVHITIGGGSARGGWSPTLFPGPIGDTKGQRKLNPHVFRHNTLTPAPFSHEVITGHSYTQENNQAIFAVNKSFIAIAGNNQYNDLGDNNAAGYSYLGYKVSTPFQWMGQQGEFAVRIANKEMRPDEWLSNWSGYDTRFHWLEKDAFDIVGVISGYTKFVLLKCGVAFAIGYNGHGQCGDGGTLNRQGWRMVGWSSSYEGVQEDQRIYKNGRKIVQMCSTSNGQDNTASTQYALTDDGRLWGWGYNG